MMIFNSFTVANDNHFGAQLPNGRRVFFPTNKTFEDIYLGLTCLRRPIHPSDMERSLRISSRRLA